MELDRRGGRGKEVRNWIGCVGSRKDLILPWALLQFRFGGVQLSLGEMCCEDYRRSAGNDLARKHQ